MINKHKISKPNWRRLGSAPDYRFSLANERTYLAWIRTALALLAGAIGIDQLTPELASPSVRIMLSICLCLCSGLLAIFAYKRWSSNEKAMRNRGELPYTSFLKIISIVMVFFTLAIIFTIII